MLGARGRGEGVVAAMSSSEVSPRRFRPEALKLPRGLDWRALESFLWRYPEINLEIGCGVGWHPIRAASRAPEQGWIAIERTREKFGKFKARLARHAAIPNLFPVHADALPFLVHAFPEPKPVLSRVLLLYPNPERQNPSRRWFRMPFFGYLLERVKPGGEILLVSNEREYVEEAEAAALRDWGLRSSGIVEVPRANEPRTHFEKKYLERGERCWEVRFFKGPLASTAASADFGALRTE